MKLQHYLLISCLILSACATRQKTYAPPSRVKMDASSARVSVAVTKAKATATKARNKVAEAQDSASKIVTLSGTVKEQLGKVENVPQELTDNVLQLQSVESVLTVQLADATTVHDTLQKELLEAEAAKVQLQKDQSEYVANAQTLADNATAERDKRITAEKALSWYRWHSWLMKIGTAIGILIIIVLVFLWVTGRLAGFAAKFL